MPSPDALRLSGLRAACASGTSPSVRTASRPLTRTFAQALQRTASETWGTASEPAMTPAQGP